MWPRAEGRGVHTIPLPELVGSKAHEREMLQALWARQAGKDAAGVARGHQVLVEVITALAYQ